MKCKLNLIRSIAIAGALVTMFYSTQSTATTKHVNGPVENKVVQETKIPKNYIAVALYKPTYLLPFYYTGSPYNSVYANETPYGESIKKSEVNYQVSLKVPVWKNIFDYPSNLYVAYTQLSYWQAYSKYPFFRETNYEPEVFVTNEVNWNLGGRWHVNFVNVGLDHQSNGYGNQLERSWNRFYLAAIASNDSWMVELMPWYPITVNAKNQNITNYLGYGRILVAYKIYNNVLSLQAHNLIEGGARRATAELTWTFPINSYFKGYVEAFSGYGQSLIEYDHHTNSIGVGFALNDWL